MKKHFTILIIFFGLLTIAKGQSFLQTLNEGYSGLNSIAFGETTITAAISADSDSLEIYKLDNYGYPSLLAAIETDLKQYGMEGCVKTGPEKFAVIIMRGETIYVQEYDLEGNMLRELPVAESPAYFDQNDYDNYTVAAFTALSSGGYTVYHSKIHSNSGDTLHYVKVGQDGAILDKKEVGVYDLNEPLNITDINDNNQVIFLDGKYSIVTGGEYLAALSVHHAGFFPGQVSAHNNIIYLFHKGSSQPYKIFRYDLNGTQLGETSIMDFSGIVKVFKVTEEGSYIVGGLSQISSYTEEGDKIWEKEIPAFLAEETSFNHAAESENGYIITGSSFGEGYGIYKIRRPITVKTGKDGELSYLNLTDADSWQSEGIDEIRLEYSSDMGNTWIDGGTFGPGDNTAGLDLFYGKYMARIYGGGILRDRLLEPELRYKEYTRLEANSISMWTSAHGVEAHDPITDDSGLFWPKGSGKAAVFNDGFLMGFKINGITLVNGSTYRSGMAPGPLGEEAEDTKFYSLYHIKKNLAGVTNDSLREFYELSYDNWPGGIGAPYTDVNNNGIYDPGTDEPLFYGDEVVYSVANFNNQEKAGFLYGSEPVEVEVRKTVYASDEDPVKSTVFKKYQFINKSDYNLENAYLSYWTDDDLGSATDDYVGVDTSMNMMYTYNGDDYDDYAFGKEPPAVGHMIVQGPIVEGESSDSGYFKDQWRHGIKNLNINSHILFIGGSSLYSDPDLGVHSGAEQVYNYMHGLVWDGSEFIDPVTEEPTKFVVSGDPVNGTGWYEGEGWPNGPAPGDRRSMISAGPFNMAPGDTQEVVFAIMIARGNSNINSIAELREMAVAVQDYYNGKVISEVKEAAEMPLDYALYQNYPNPFNPATVINYQIPEEGHVSLKVYDILGNEIATLVNGRQKEGRYEVNFNASHLSSGVYFYRIEAGKFSSVKKMALIK